MFYKIIKAIAIVIFAPFIPRKVIGKENVPKEGGFVLAVNHRSMLDVIVAAVSCPRPLHYMAKKELFKNKFLRWFFTKVNAFPVDRAGNDLKAIKTALSLLKNGKVLGIFPEGTRVKEGEDVSAKAGVSMLAIKSKVCVVPTVIVGEYKLFKKIHIVFGEPISMEKYYAEKLTGDDFLKISASILDQIKKMGQDTKKSLAKDKKMR